MLFISAHFKVLQFSLSDSVCRSDFPTVGSLQAIEHSIFPPTLLISLTDCSADS